MENLQTRLRLADSRDGRVLLFDLGGVLVDWDGVSPLLSLCGSRIGAEEARRFWLVSPWVRRFERGECTPLEFAAGAVEELGLRLAADAFLADFATWDRGPYPGAVELVRALRRTHRVACLSNNNELHWRRIHDLHGLGSLFDRSYLSFEIGRVKPDPEAFEFVIGDLGCAAERIIYFDDNPECVAAAAAARMQARLVRGISELRRALEKLGIEPSATEPG